MKGQTDVVVWLLDHPRLDSLHLQPDEDGYVPSAMAEYQGHAELATLLREAEVKHGIAGVLEILRASDVLLHEKVPT